MKYLTAVYITGPLAEQVEYLAALQIQYAPEYEDLHIKQMRICGHPFHCECRESMVLFGEPKVIG